MTRGWWLGLFLLGALVYSLVSTFQPAPGYMDADYYAVSGGQIASGQGFKDPFIWNYLNQPSGIPTPSHLYWMPLASILVALGISVTKSAEFVWIKLPFVLMAAFLIPLAAALGRSFLREKRFAWLCGAAAAFAGLYWVYLTLPETFGIYMLAGAGLIVLVGTAPWLRIATWKRLGLAFLVGLLAGIMHLTRADGILWLVGSLIWVSGTAISELKGVGKISIFRIASLLGVILCGYLVVMAPWYIRNLNMFGTLMPPGNVRTLWLTSYNQTYDFPASDLTFTNWIASGWGALLLSRWQALKLNLANLLVVQGGIAFLPLIIVGIWRFRKDSRIRFLFFMWLLTFLVMTLVFPFAGARGGYLHSGAAFQLFFWALIPVGLETLLEWGNWKRGWSIPQGFAVLGAGLVIVAMVLSSFFLSKRVIGPDLAQPVWGQSERAYHIVGAALPDMGILPEEIGAVNNPPGYYLATGRPSIVIPNGNLTHLFQAAKTYHAAYLILEQSQANLQELYANPGDQAGLDYLGAVENIQIYRILSDE